MAFNSVTHSHHGLPTQSGVIHCDLQKQLAKLLVGRQSETKRFKYLSATNRQYTP